MLLKLRPKGGKDPPRERCGKMFLGEETGCAKLHKERPAERRDGWMVCVV